MKKYNILIISMVLILSFTSVAYSNSGPTYWEGYPSLEVLAVEENSPIEVENEELVFDFSREEYVNRGDHSISALVTAAYKMSNPTDNKINVQMAFPFVSSLNHFNPDEVVIKADENLIPFKIYIGNRINLNGRNTVGSDEDKIDFEKIVGSISNQVYSPNNYNLDEVGTLYTYDIKTMGEENVRITIDYTIDHEKTKVVGKGFNGYEGNENQVKLTSWVRDKESFELFVIGEDIKFDINGYTDGELKSKTDNYSYELETKTISIRDYMDKEVNAYKEEYAYNDYIAENQFFNIYANVLDEMIENNAVNMWADEIYSMTYVDRILVFVYDVEFLQQSSRDISISYLARGAMDKTETKEPLYTFDYLLNPAANWASFKDLNIAIIPPKDHPYIVDSSLELVRNDDGIYTGKFESLPNEDLSFTLYSKEKVGFIDKVEKHVYQLPYYLPIIVVFALPILIVAIFLLIVTKKNKGDLR